MKPGIAIVAILLFIGLIAIIGGGGYVAARSFTKSEKNRKLEFLGQTKPSPKLEARPSPLIIPTPAISPPPLTLSPSASPTPIASSELRYKQPHGKYTIILPAGWAVNNINSTSTYSTTKFTGPDGNISITFGSGKAMILKYIDETGSIAKAAKKLDMSYRHAWSYIKSAEGRMGRPLVRCVRGGNNGGGAALTDYAKEMLEKFIKLEQRVKRFTDKVYREIF